MIKYKVITYRNPDDFIFGTRRYEALSHGEGIIYGMLKKTKNWSKFQRIKRV
jgi:hypothetical protein